MRSDESPDRDTPPPLRVSLSGSAQAWRLQAQIQDLAATRAICALEAGARMPFAVGDSLGLWLSMPSRNVEQTFPTRLVHRLEQPQRTVLDLELLEPATFRDTLHPELARALRQRVHPRVAASGPVTLVPPPDSERALEVAELRDLSDGGLAVEVSPTFEESMAGKVDAECLLRLPGSADQLALPVKIRHRALLPSGRIRYGLMFAESDNHQARASRAAVVAWVERQAAR